MSSQHNNSVEYFFQRTVESLRISGKSKRTAETYAREVRIMGRWLNKPLDWRVEHVCLSKHNSV